MNRRDFMRYMAVTPAVAAASTALAKIKEAADPIGQLVVAPSTSEALEVGTDGIYVFQNVIEYEFRNEQNISLHAGFASRAPMPVPVPGLITNTIAFDTYLSEGLPLTLDKCSYFRFRVEIPLLKNRLFLLGDFTASSSVQRPIVASVKGIEVVP